MYERLKAEQSRMIRTQLAKWCSAVERGDYEDASFRAREVGVLVQLVALAPQVQKDWKGRGGALASASPQDLAAGASTFLSMLAEMSGGGSVRRPGPSIVPGDGTAAR